MRIRQAVPRYPSHPQGTACDAAGRTGLWSCPMNVIDTPLLGLSQRLPPSNMQAEQALLGALLANNRAYERVAEFLAPEHFADPIHGRIFAAIHRRVNNGQLADAITLRAEFEHAGVLDEVGGTAYLTQLLTAMVGIINAGEYGRAIHDAWLRRQLIDVGEEVVNNAFGADPEMDGKTRSRRPSRRCSTSPTRAASRRLHRLRAGADHGDPGRRAGLPPPGPRLRPGHRPARPGQEDGRAAPVRPDDPGRPARHGQDRAGHQDRVRRGPVPAGGRPAAGPRRRAEGQRRLLHAGDERRADRPAPAGGGGAGVRRQDPPRRHRAARFRPLRAGQPRDRRPAAAYRRDAGHLDRGAAHPLPPAEADAAG